MSIATACRLANTSKETVYAWLRLGATEPESEYGTFREGFERARATAVLRLTRIVARAAKKDWRAAAQMLRVLEPEVWDGRDLKVERARRRKAVAEAEAAERAVERAKRFTWMLQQRLAPFDRGEPGENIGRPEPEGGDDDTGQDEDLWRPEHEGGDDDIGAGTRCAMEPEAGAEPPRLTLASWPPAAAWLRQHSTRFDGPTRWASGQHRDTAERWMGELGSRRPELADAVTRHDLTLVAKAWEEVFIQAVETAVGTDWRVPQDMGLPVERGFVTNACAWSTDAPVLVLWSACQRLARCRSLPGQTTRSRPPTSS